MVYAGLFLLFTLCTLSLKAQRVRFFSPNDGLSNSHITQIYQDSKGYIWIATENGLNKFDGYDFEVYLPVPDDSTSIQSNYISRIHEDSRGLFWVAASNGLLLYDRTRDAFSRWQTGEVNAENKDPFISYIFEDRNHNLWIAYPDRVVRLDANTLSPVVFDKQSSGIDRSTVRCIFEDRHGNLWFGTENNGIYVLNPQNNTVKHYHSADSSGLNNNAVFSICEEANGDVWAGTMGGGINVFDEHTQSFHAPYYKEINPLAMENLTYSLLLDNHQTVWIGTDGAGIFRYDVNKNRTSYWEEISSVYDLRKAKVHAFFQDKQENIWVALHQKGVLFISASGNSFQKFGYNPYHVSKSIGTHCVTSIVEDHHGNVWAGTDGDGLYRIHPSGNVDHFMSDHTPGFLGDVITALFEDRDHQIWIGTFLHGFFRFHPQTGKIDSHYQKSDSKKGLNSSFVSGFAQDDEGNLWISTGGGGISVFNPKTHQFKHYELSSSWVSEVIIGRDRGIWASTGNGLNRFNKETDKFEVFGIDDDNYKMTPSLHVLYEDKKDNIWAGSYFGLYRFDKNTEKVTLITTVDGLPDNLIAGIKGDEDHVLWISTGRGLCRYDPETGECLNFYAEDGIQSNEFRRGSHFKGMNDKIYFGGINGITAFYPSQIMYEKPLLGLIFTGFLVNDKPVSLKKSIDETTGIRLKYNQRSFVFSFTALEFEMPQRVNYYIQMENFETQWRQIGNSTRSANYTNLSPGNYVFKVKATIDGKNVLQKEIQIVILYPWWQSIIAKLVYVMLVILSLYGIYAYLSYRASKRHRMLEQQHLLLEQTVEQRTKELLLAKDKAEESDKLKSAFLTNMSHEILTPLNGIVGFLKFFNSDDLSLLHRQEYIKTINNSATQLVTIINDIIDVSKIEVKQLTISPVPVDLNELMHEMWVFFNEYLQTYNKEHIKLILDNSGFIDLCVICVDPLRLRQVLSNLISNAIKFTDEGFVRFGYRQTKPDILEFVVEDTGIGMRQDQMEVIFERFRQADKGTELRRLYGGTGLGLTIARSLVQMSGGEMWVESTEGIGSSFYFTILYLPVKQHNKISRTPHYFNGSS